MRRVNEIADNADTLGRLQYTAMMLFNVFLSLTPDSGRSSLDADLAELSSTLEVNTTEIQKAKAKNMPIYYMAHFTRDFLTQVIDIMAAHKDNKKVMDTMVKALLYIKELIAGECLDDSKLCGANDNVDKVLAGN